MERNERVRSASEGASDRPVFPGRASHAVDADDLTARRESLMHARFGLPLISTGQWSTQ